MMANAPKSPDCKPDAPTEISDDDLDVRGGSGRRVELDHAGAYNFGVEIEGVAADDAPAQKTIIGGFKSMTGMD